MGSPVRLLDRVCIATTTGGTGSYALGAAPSGYLDPFVAGGASGDRVTYVVESEDRATWELSEGIITAGSPPTLSRARVVRNSSGGTAAVNWPAGTTKYITIVGVSDRLAVLNTDGSLQQHRVADGANTWNLPGRTLRTSSQVWASTPFDLSTTDTVFLADVVPECSFMLVSVTARLDYTAPSGATTAILRLKVGSDTTQSVSQAALSYAAQNATMAFAVPRAWSSPVSSVSVSAMALKSDAVGPCRVINLRMDVFSW